MLHRFALAGLLLGMVSCAPASPRIVVQLVTDYVPVRDFDAIAVSHDGTTETFDVARDRSYGRAVRVTELGVSAGGRVTITLALLLRGAAVQAQPRLATPLAGGTIVTTFLITRDCGGVSCPDASEADAIACVGGRCINPECSPEHPELCPPCGGGCPASPIACVDNTCRPEGVCFLSADDSRCGMREVCVVDEGCRDPSVDAGAPDDAAAPDAAATDAAATDAAATDAAATDAAELDAGPIDAGSTSDVSVVCLPGAVRFDEHGAGTRGSPYVLCTSAQWDSFTRVGVTNAAYRLDADLSVTSGAASFEGTFDGGGHTLTGPPRTESLFGIVRGGTIRDLRVEIWVNPGPPADDVGVLASVASDATFDRDVVRIMGIVYGRDRVGGIAGTCIRCAITDSVISIDRIVGFTDVGLVAGATSGGSIQRVSAVTLQLEPQGTADCVNAGGLVGHATGTTIAECDVSVAMATVGAAGYGGAVGWLDGASSLSDVRVFGSITPPAVSTVCATAVGGLVGRLSDAASLRHAVLSADVMTGGGLVGDWVASSTGAVVDSIVLGSAPGFPNVFFGECPAGAMQSGLHYFATKAPVGTPVLCTPPDLGHGDPAYFADPTNPPMNAWDFVDVWTISVGGVPALLRTPPPP